MSASPLQETTTNVSREPRRCRGWTNRIETAEKGVVQVHPRAPSKRLLGHKTRTSRPERTDVSKTVSEEETKVDLNMGNELYK